MIQVFLMYALFGSIFSVGKIAIGVSQPYFLTGIRMLLAGTCILSYLFLQKQNLFIPKSLWILFILVAFFNVFITNAFEFWGLQYMSAGKTCLIYSLSPFIAAFIGYFFGKEVMTSKKWLGLFIGIAAFCPMMLGPWFNETQTESNVSEFLAEAALFVSSITCVVGWYFVKQLTVSHRIPDAIVNGYSFFLAGIMCLIPSLIFENWEPVPVTEWSTFFLTLFYIVIIHNFICYTIYAASLHRFSITFLTFAGLSNPMFAGLFGWLFLGEEITFSFIFALIGISVGLILFYIDEKNSAFSLNHLSISD